MNRLRDGALAGSVLAGHQHVGFRRPDALNQFEHRSHRRGFRDQQRTHIRFQRSVFGFEPLLAPKGARQLHLRANHRQQPGVLPGLLDEIAGAAAHRLNGHLDAAPGGHHHERQRRIVRAQLRQQVQAFLARCGVARVIEIH